MADLISVIVPVYNIAADLPRCLNSILAQTYPSIEIVAVDDGSPDESAVILDRYAAIYPNIRVIHQANGGVTSARLRGVAEASGEWIGFVDGDDEIEPDMYERLQNNANKYDAQISHCGYQMHFADGRIHYFHDTGILAKQDKTTALKELLSGSRIEPGLCNKLFRKNLFHSLLHDNVMDCSIKINEDLLMNFYLFSAAEISVFDDWCPYHYIVRSTSASRSKLNEHKIYDPIRVKEIILADVCDELRHDAQKSLVSTCVYSYCGLLLEKEYPTAYAKSDLQKKMKDNYAWIQLLPRRTKLLAKLIVYMPRLLEIVYPIYAQVFQKSQYN